MGASTEASGLLACLQENAGGGGEGMACGGQSGGVRKEETGRWCHCWGGGGKDWAGPWPSLRSEAQRWPQQEEKGLLASPAGSCQALTLRTLSVK